MDELEVQRFFDHLPLDFFGVDSLTSVVYEEAVEEVSASSFSNNDRSFSEVDTLGDETTVGEETTVAIIGTVDGSVVFKGDKGVIPPPPPPPPLKSGCPSVRAATAAGPQRSSGMGGRPICPGVENLKVLESDGPEMDEAAWPSGPRPKQEESSCVEWLKKSCGWRGVMPSITSAPSSSTLSLWRALSLSSPDGCLDVGYLVISKGCQGGVRPQSLYALGIRVSSMP